MKEQITITITITDTELGFNDLDRTLIVEDLVDYLNNSLSDTELAEVE